MKFKNTEKKEPQKKATVKKDKKTESKKEELKELVTETVEEVLKEKGIESISSPEPKAEGEKVSEKASETSNGEKPTEESKEVTIETSVIPNTQEPIKSSENEEKSLQPDMSQPIQPTQTEEPKVEVTPEQKAEGLKQDATIATTPVITSSGAPIATSVPTSEPMQAKPAKKSHFLIILVMLVIFGILVGCGIFYAYTNHMVSLPSSVTNLLPKAKTTPVTSIVSPTTPTPTTVSVDLTKYTISVLNGSGIAGEAAKAKTSLTAAGYKVGTTGNAVTSDYTETFIAAKDSVDSEYLAGLTAQLQKTYVVSKSIAKLTSPDSADVIVTIGNKPAAK